MVWKGREQESTVLLLLAVCLAAAYPYNAYYQQEDGLPWYQGSYQGAYQGTPYKIGTGVQPNVLSMSPYYPYYTYNWDSFNTDFYNPYNNH